MKPHNENFAAAASDDAGAYAGPIANPLGALLAKHLLRDGEIVQLMIRPSRWFILLTSLRFVSLVAILTCVTVIYLHQHGRDIDSRRCIEIGVGIAAGRVMWAIIQWMSRLYILTNIRIVAIKGVFNSDIFDCPLRKVARVVLESTFKEKAFLVGSITIVPQDDHMPIGSWWIISQPEKILQIIRKAIQNAKQG